MFVGGLGFLCEHVLLVPSNRCTKRDVEQSVGGVKSEVKGVTYSLEIHIRHYL